LWNTIYRGIIFFKFGRYSIRPPFFSIHVLQEIVIINLN
jgi:hypothetical protein